MKKVMKTKREKLKWFTALCMCLLCFSLCLSMLARPVLADEPGFLDDLDRIGALRWDDTNRGTHKDSFGDMHPGSYAFGTTFTESEKAFALGWARYRLDNKPEGNFAAISGRIACADASTADASMRLKIYGDNEGAAPIYTSPIIQRSTRPFEFRVDLRGVKTMRMELEQVDLPSLPEGQTSSAFALLSELMLMHEPAPGLPASLHKLIPLESSWVMAPLSYTDSLGGTHFCGRIGGTLDATGTMGVMGSARYQLDKKYSSFHGKLACAAEGAADAVMQVKLYADGSATPLYTSPPIKRTTQPFDFSVSVSGVSALKIELVGTTDPKAAQSPLSGWILLDMPMLELAPSEPTTTTALPTSTGALPGLTYRAVAGWTGLYEEFTAHNDVLFFIRHVYSFTRHPETDRLLGVVARARDAVYPQVQTVEDIFIDTYYGTFNNAQLVSLSLKGVFYPAEMESVTLGGYTFRVPYGKMLVYDQERFYSLATAYAQGVLRKEDIAAIANIFNSAAMPTLPALTPAQALKIKEDFLGSVNPLKYYVHVFNNNVYCRLTPDGLFDINDAVWLGPDGEFGTADDKIPVLRAGSFFYEESPGVWKFLVSRFDYADLRWATVVTTPTTTAPTTSATGAIETTTNDFLNTGDQGGPPKTGASFNVGLLVCVAALFMGCMYCGYRLFRKERA